MDLIAYFLGRGAGRRKAPCPADTKTVMGLWREEDLSGAKVSGFMFCGGCNVGVPVDAADRICTPLYYCPKCGKEQF